jgi:ribonuclease HI
MAKQKFYVVWKGRQTGIFNTWEACSAQVSGFSGAEYKAFETGEAAEKAWHGQYQDYAGKHVSALSEEQLRLIGQPLTPSWAVDAACTGSPGLVEYRGVETQTGKTIFRQGPFADGTNNIGEFLALVHALALCQKKNLSLPIYTDSETALAWVRVKQCKTELPRTEKNAEIFALIERAEAWLQNNPYPNPLLKWETEAWGEIPADFGRK